MSFRGLVGVSVVLVLLGVGCRRIVISSGNAESYQHVVVRADQEYSLTMSELYYLLLDSREVPYGGTLERSGVKRFLDSVVCETLTGLAAYDIALEDHYSAYRLFRRPYYDMLIREWVRSEIYERIELDSAEVAKYYHANSEVFAVEEKVLLYHILSTGLGLKYSADSMFYRGLSPEQLEEQTEAESRRIHGLLDSGQDFEAVAKANSHDNLAGARSGWKGWTARGVYKNPLDSVAFALRAGQYSDPYGDEDGWHIVYVEDYQPPGLPELDSLQYTKAHSRLLGERANVLSQPLVDSLTEVINLEFHEEVLDTNVYFVDRQQWAAILNGTDTIDFNDLRGWEESTRKKYRVDNTTVEMKKETLEKLAKRYIVIQAARVKGIDTLAHVRSEKARLQHVRCRVLARRGWTDTGWIPKQREVENYFNKHIDEFRPEKPLKVQHIIVEDSVFGEFVRDQAMSGIDFLSLADEYYPGEESIRRDLADLGGVGPGDVSPEFYQAALITPVGDVSYPVKTEYGYHVIKVLDRFDEPDVNRVRSKISTLLKKQHAVDVFREYRDDLYRRFGVRFGPLYPVHLKPVEYRTE